MAPFLDRTFGKQTGMVETVRYWLSIVLAILVIGFALYLLRKLCLRFILSGKSSSKKSTKEKRTSSFQMFTDEEAAKNA